MASRMSIPGVGHYFLFLGILLLSGIIVPRVSRGVYSLEPWMTKDEVDSMMTVIHGQHKILEYGSGGSTLLIGEKAEWVVSVEHDPKWCREMSLHLDSLDNVELICSKVVKGTKGWKGGFNEGDANMFFSYITSPFSIRPVGGFDRILLDGRARVYCAIFGLNLLSPDGLLIIHDFTRPYYKEILEYYSLVNQTRSLAILEPKRPLNQKDSLIPPNLSNKKLIDHKETLVFLV